MPSLVGSGLAERPSRVERRPSLLEGYGKSSKAAGRVGSAHGPETHRAESPKLLAVFRRLRLGGTLKVHAATGAPERPASIAASTEPQRFSRSARATVPGEDIW
jgi:hypothetical protein